MSNFVCECPDAECPLRFEDYETWREARERAADLDHFKRLSIVFPQHAGSARVIYEGDKYAIVDYATKGHSTTP